MKKTKVIYIVTIFVAIMMISIGLVLEKDLSGYVEYKKKVRYIISKFKIWQQVQI